MKFKTGMVLVCFLCLARLVSADWRREEEPKIFKSGDTVIALFSNGDRWINLPYGQVLLIDSHDAAIFLSPEGKEMQRGNWNPTAGIFKGLDQISPDRLDKIQAAMRVWQNREGKTPTESGNASEKNTIEWINEKNH